MKFLFVLTQLGAAVVRE